LREPQKARGIPEGDLFERHKFRFDDKCELYEAAKESLQSNVELASSDLFWHCWDGNREVSSSAAKGATL